MKTIIISIAVVFFHFSVAAESDPVSVVFHSKDPVIRQLVLEALQDMLNINIGDRSRSGSITDWSIEATREMRLLLLPENQVKARVEARLEAFLNGGREQGLSQNPEAMKLLNQDLVPGRPSGSSFAEKYNPATYSDLRKKLGQRNRDDVSYIVGLGMAYKLASEVNDQAHISEISMQMVRFNDLHRAMGLADPEKDAAALINLGMIYAFDVLNSPYPFGSLLTSQLSGAIWAWGRVRGPLKTKAEQILLDFAHELMKNANPKAGFGMPNREGYAIRAISLTGRLKDPAIINEIQLLSDQAMSHDYNYRYHADDVREALLAIGDTERLNRYETKLRPEARGGIGKPEDVLTKQIRSEQSWREENARLRSQITPEARRKWIEEGYALLNKSQAWAAYGPFRKALYRQGLLETAQSLIQAGDGLNAMGTITAAATLLPEDN